MMSEPVELTVHELEPVALTTSVVVPAPAPGWSLELGRTDTHIRVRQVRGDETTAWVDVVPLSLLQGADGSTPSLRATATHLEWSQDEVEWFPLVALEDLKGDDGADAYEVAVALGYEGDRDQWLAELHGTNGEDGWSPYVTVSATHIQVGYTRGDESVEPVDLVALSSLTGADGYSVEVQKTATHIQWRQKRGATVTAWTNLVALTDITGAAGQGVPTGGTTGQVLVKTSATNYATAWQAPSTTVVTFSSPTPDTTTVYAINVFATVLYGATPATNVGGGVWTSPASTWRVPVTGTYLITSSIRLPDDAVRRPAFQAVHTSNADGAWGYWQDIGKATGDGTGVNQRGMYQYTRVARFVEGDLLRHIVRFHSTGSALHAQGTAWTAALISAG